MLCLTSPARTRWHAVPAGWKLAGLAVFSTLIFPEDRIGVLALATAGVALLYLAEGRRFARAGLRQLRALLPFLLVIVVYHAATGTIPAGAVVALRLLSAVAAANLVTMTTRLEDMMAVVEAALRPLQRLGLNVGALAVAVALVVRFTPALAEKVGRLIEAWRGRSARRAGWRIVPPFLLLALDDAEHVAEAIRARGGIEPQRPVQ
jgi:biotin transport system permease protein